ncbi:MAG: hypothetical protein ABEI27_14450 [Halobellus sp.]|uniref:hypothetical protein n=1 Tax=Halobellus sp. TaxID=1979212 RepID=UPI0035D3FC4D
MPAAEHRPATGASTVARTRAALDAAGGRGDSRLVFASAGLGYLAAYLFTVGDLAITGGSGGLSVRTAADLSRAVASLGFFRFDAIAVLSAGPIVYLFSPLNVLLGLSLGGLVGANLALTYLGIVQPQACGLESSAGVLAGVPALLSGAACCGPTILLVVGIQASATIVTGFQFLVPIAFAMLVGSLLLVGRKVDPELL